MKHIKLFIGIIFCLTTSNILFSSESKKEWNPGLGSAIIFLTIKDIFSEKEGAYLRAFLSASAVTVGSCLDSIENTNNFFTDIAKYLVVTYQVGTLYDELNEEKRKNEKLINQNQTLQYTNQILAEAVRSNIPVAEIIPQQNQQ